MPYSAHRRKQRARLHYANDSEVRLAAQERARHQRERIKSDPAYRERWNAWQRKHRQREATRYRSEGG